METKAEKPKCIRKVQSAKSTVCFFTTVCATVVADMSWLRVLPIFRRN